MDDRHNSYTYSTQNRGTSRPLTSTISLKWRAIKFHHNAHCGNNNLYYSPSSKMPRFKYERRRNHSGIALLTPQAYNKATLFTASLHVLQFQKHFYVHKVLTCKQYCYSYKFTVVSTFQNVTVVPPLPLLQLLVPMGSDPDNLRTWVTSRIWTFWTRWSQRCT